MIDVRAAVTDLDPADLVGWSRTLTDPNDLALLEQIVGDLQNDHWRSDPAQMAAALDGKQLWDYVVLLGRCFKAGITGEVPEDLAWLLPNPRRQQWWVPSQTGKTTTVRAGIAWALDRDDTMRFLYLSYDANKAAEEAGEVRDFAEEHADVLRFQLRADRRARGRWRTRGGGGLYATGIHGGITGYPADAVVADDLMKGWQAAHSEAERDFVWNTWRSQVRMRLQGLDCPIFSVGTRWHEDDPQARMLEAATEDEPWSVIRLPAIAEAPDPRSPNWVIRLPDPLGREPGQIIEPARFPLAEVKARQSMLGTYLWSALEQGRPSPEEGTDILRAWFKLESIKPPRPDRAIASWDMKLKDKEAGDYVVGGCWWRVGGGYWLVDIMRGQWNEATTKAAFALMAVRHPEIHHQVYENTGNAPEVVTELKRGMPTHVVSEHIAGQLGMTTDERLAVEALLRRGMSKLVPETPRGDKRVRMRAFAPLIEGGDVHMLESEPWVPLYLEEMAAFPNGAHDDQVDMTSQALKRLSQARTKTKRTTQGVLPPVTAAGELAAVGRLMPGRRVT